MTDPEKLLNRLLEFRKARDWEQFHNPKDASLSLVLEAAELMEHFQWKNSEEMKEHVKTHKDEVGAELADILYWVLLMSHDFGINVFDELGKKMDKNDKRYLVEKSKGNHLKYNEL